MRKPGLQRRLAFGAMVAACTLLALTLSGCCSGGDGGGGGARDPEAAKRRELSALKKDEQRLQRLAEAIGQDRYAIVSLAGPEFESAANKALPIVVNAKTLNNNVGGTITISALRNVRVTGGKVSFDLVGKGKKITVSSLGRMALGSKKVNKYIAAVQGGMTVRVAGKIDAAKGKLVFKGKAISVKLKKSKGMAKDIKKALNGSFFKKPHTIALGQLSAGGQRLSVRDAFVAGAQVAIVFAP